FETQVYLQTTKAEKIKNKQIQLLKKLMNIHGCRCSCGMKQSLVFFGKASPICTTPALLSAARARSLCSNCTTRLFLEASSLPRRQEAFESPKQTICPQPLSQTPDKASSCNCQPIQGN
ncbi:hypothetical protein IscW_ISCW017700, partial [Ixodes scapularis]